MKARLKKKQQVYSDMQITQALAVLDSNAGNVSLTTRQTGIPGTTLRSWRDGQTKRAKSPDATKMHKEQRENLADIFEDVAHLYLKQARRGKVVVKTTGQAAIIAAATATDKMRLLRDQGPPPTEAAKTAAEAIKQAAEALVQLSKGTRAPLNPAKAEELIKQIQLASSHIQ